MTAAASPCRLPLRRGLLPIQTAPNAPAGGAVRAAAGARAVRGSRPPPRARLGWQVWNSPERCSAARGGSESGRSDWGDLAVEARLRSDHTGSPAASAAAPRPVVQGRLA